MTHPCTIIGWTLNGAVLCDECGSNLEKYPRIGHGCRAPFQGPVDPGWCGCGERGADGAPCRAVLESSHEGTGSGDDVCPVFGDSELADGSCCGDCGAVWIGDGTGWTPAEDALARAWTVCPSCNHQAPSTDYHKAGSPCASCGAPVEDCPRGQ